MEQKPPVKYFRSALNGFDKKDVTEYITKLHLAQRKEIDKYKQFATSLQMAHVKLREECEALKRQLGEQKTEKIIETRIVEVPVEKYIEVPKYQTLPGEPDEELLAKLRQNEAEFERLGRQIDAHIAVREQLERKITSQVTENQAVQNEKAALREQVGRLTAALKAMEEKTRVSGDAETLAYHRAEAIEREAKYNAAQIRLALEELLREAQEVLRGVKTQTVQETSQITARANQFLELLSNMPEMLDIVSRQVEAVRPEGIATPMLLDTFD